jgi:hypothetical protein
MEQLRTGYLPAGPRISKNFRLYELTRSETAARQVINNSFPGAPEQRAAEYLCPNGHTTHSR